MRVIIIGCGRVGSNLANVLSAERHDVVIIDNNPQSFRRLSREFTGRMLTGVGFDREVLQKADIEGTQALAATTDSDNVNIVAAVTAKDVFRVPHVVARIYDPQVAEIYRREGIPTVTPTSWAASTMKTMITTPHLTAVATLGSGEVEFVAIEVTKALAGRSLQDVVLPGESVVGAVVRRGQAMLVASDARLELEDQVYLTVAVSAIPKLEKLLSR
jgi:trk system potassium uptake protein TrkA